MPNEPAPQSIRVMLSLTPKEMAKIDARRGLIPRATFLKDLAMRAATTAPTR